MIEVFAPYLLILLGWNDHAPEATMKIIHELHISEAACMKAGEERMKMINADRQKRTKEYEDGQIKTEANKFFCVPYPRDIQKPRDTQNHLELDDN
ncbi:hypothetical protein AB1K62_01950 [Parasphingorhabdus sp. JC815]|uniref:hypothetical protein n=1 Tax=Parasphingorhabdus sp. JC815 TaxID=3232140 RepID=UPI00345A3B42